MTSEPPKVGGIRTGSLPPAFSTRDACRTWLDGQAGIASAQALPALRRQLERLGTHRLPADERLAILELLRDPVHLALAEARRDFAGRALPLKPAEQASLEANVAAWGALADGYGQYLEACVDAGVDGALPLAAQRALAALVELQLDSCRGGRSLPAGHWRKLNRCYAVAESAGAALKEVADPRRRNRLPATPLATWSESQLLQLAGLHELPATQMAWAARWAQRWSGKIAIGRDLPPAGRAAPLFASLDADRPAGYRPVGGEERRVLDTTGLKRSLKKRVLLLEEGRPPAEIGLGDDCVLPQARELLIRMYQRWCKGGIARRHVRRCADGNCIVIGGFEAAHFHVSGGKLHEQPETTLYDRRLRRQREELAVFGRIVSAVASTDEGDGSPDAHGRTAMEFWRLADQSATGLRLVRPAGSAGGRLINKQLVAVRTTDMKVLHLGSVRRATIDAEDALHAGVRMLVGVPEPVAVCGTGINLVRGKSAPAFMMPAVSALGEPPSIVLPTGWFKRERVLEVLSTHNRLIRLTGLIERGSDYERATYDAAAQPGTQS